MSRFIDPVPQYLDGKGDPLINGKLYFYKAGTNTPIITYADSDGEFPNTNPLLLNSAADVPNVFFEGSAKIVLTHDILSTGQVGVQRWERDTVGGDNEDGNFLNYSSSITYGKYEIVIGSDGAFYVSLSNNNQSNDPTLTPSKWECWPVNGKWNATISYPQGAVVQLDGGDLYKAIISNANVEPSSDEGLTWVPAVNGNKIPEVIDLIDSNSWGEPVTANFTIQKNKARQVNAITTPVDIAFPAIESGDVFTYHNMITSTNKVQIMNPIETIKGTSGSVLPGVNLELSPGDSVQLVAVTPLILSVVGAQA